MKFARPSPMPTADRTTLATVRVSIEKEKRSVLREEELAPIQ
jgi:hypothetical protein